MRILCLHGRGSNNEIFRMQTAAIRSDLEDFEWEFVQGTFRHTEGTPLSSNALHKSVCTRLNPYLMLIGNWSLYTTSFSKLPLYGYYYPLDPASVLQAEEDLFAIIREQGPFDGVLGYSGGASLAAQLIIKDQMENPLALPHERAFRFGIFINAASPLNCFSLDDYAEGQLVIHDTIKGSIAEEAADIVMRPSALRKKAGIENEDQPDAEAVIAAFDKLKGVTLPDGSLGFTDGEYGMVRYNAVSEDTLIDIPTLHVRCPAEHRHHGLHLYEMCEPSTALEYHHGHDHDFPRGRTEMKRIAELIREVADMA
ncbi:unnamed protein product [Clonostachys solani]|uniref:Serine hydrolase domain-containing protein n=1 Tax=Clonostachys solani TaxID=160281 RepID=A0A9P0EL36_9HYPO|nr:unnamed protein product [Clonostachys solani]